MRWANWIKDASAAVRRVEARGGAGGAGCSSLATFWGKARAGPDGGDGGHGGHVVFQATHTVRTLGHVPPVLLAAAGQRGRPADRHGAGAPPLVVRVPIGTAVRAAAARGSWRDAAPKSAGAALLTEGAAFVAARGGAGGRGNKFFASPTRRAPTMAEAGARGETRVYELRLPLRRAKPARLAAGLLNDTRDRLVGVYTRTSRAVQSMAHLTDECPIWSLEGGLQKVHSADQEAIEWLLKLPSL